MAHNVPPWERDSLSYREREQAYINDQIRRQTDAMKLEYERQGSLSDYMQGQSSNQKYERMPGKAGIYTSTPENAATPLVRPNKKLLLLTT